MFCPDINSECVGDKCRDWSREERKCQKTIGYEYGEQLARGYQEIVESQKFSNISSRLFLNQLLSNPLLTPEEKALIELALKAPTAEVAEKLLKEAKLLPGD